MPAEQCQGQAAPEWAGQGAHWFSASVGIPKGAAPRRPGKTQLSIGAWLCGLEAHIYGGLASCQGLLGAGQIHKWVRTLQRAVWVEARSYFLWPALRGLVHLVTATGGRPDPQLF